MHRERREKKREGREEVNYGGANYQIGANTLHLHICNTFNNIMTCNERGNLFPTGILQHVNKGRSELFVIYHIGSCFMQSKQSLNIGTEADRKSGKS